MSRKNPTTSTAVVEQQQAASAAQVEFNVQPQLVESSEVQKLQEEIAKLKLKNTVADQPAEIARIGSF